MTADIDRINNRFTESKLNRFEESWSETRRIAYEMTNIEQRVANCSRTSELAILFTDIENKMTKFATKDQFKHLEDVLSQYTKRIDFEKLKN